MATLVGRERELREAREALDRTRLLTIRGPPGVGKTALARALVRRRAHVVAPALDGAEGRAGVLAAIAAALGLTLRARDERIMLDRVAAGLEARTLLLDGGERAADTLRAVVADLLDGTETTTIVVCALRAFALPSEQVLRLEPLASGDAIALLEDRVMRLAPERRLHRADAEALVAHAGALPLAVELLAARVAALGARDVLSALDRHGLVSDALDRVLDAAWAGLAPEDRAALAALSVLRGPFTPANGERLIGTPHAQQALERLCACSLVQSSEGPDDVTLWLLGSIRDHAARRGVDPAARARHCAAFARESTPRADDPALWRALQRERADLIAAWTWACDHASARRQALQLAVTLEPVLVTQGPAALHRHVLEETLARCAGIDAATEIDLRLALGRFDALRGRHRTALAQYRAALAAAEQGGDRTRTGWAAASCCFSGAPAGEAELARAWGQRALELARELRDLRLTAMAEQALGCGWLAAGDPDLAEPAFRRAITAARLAHAPRLEGIAHANLGVAHLERDAHDEARRAFADARDAFTAADDRFHLARVTVHQAVVAGDETALLAALDQEVALDDRDGELCAREALVRLARARGEDALAERRFDELALLARLADDVSWPRRLERLAQPARERAPRRRGALRLTRDGRTLTFDDRPVDFSRRGPLRRVLLALVEARVAAPDRALTALELQAAGWPGEKMFPESGAARVYMAVRRLRALGLEAVLLTRDEGYALDPAVDVAWLEPPQM